MHQARRAFGHYDPQNNSCNHIRRVEGRALYGLLAWNPSWTLAPQLLWPKQRCFRQSRDCKDRTLSRRVDQNSGGNKFCPLDELNLTIAAEDRLALWRIDLKNTKVDWKHHSQDWEKFARLNSTVWALNSRNCRNLMLYKWVENWSNALVRDIIPSCSLWYNGTKGSKI